MTPKEYLSNVRKKDIEIIALEDAILETETKLKKVTQTLSDMPRGTSCNDKMSDGISKLIELKNLLNNKINKICEDKGNIIKEIWQLQDPNHRTILIERYLNYKSFEEISIQMGYSYYHVCRLHGQSLQEYQKVIDKK